MLLRQWLVGTGICLLIIATMITRTSAAPEQAAPQVVPGDEQQLAPGVWLQLLEGSTYQGDPLRGAMLTVDLNEPLLEVRTATAAGGIGRLETLSQMARRHSAVAAINGGFFNTDPQWNLPIGNLVQDGILLSQSDILRPSLGWNSQDQLLLGYFNPRWEVELGGQVLPVTRLNRPHWGQDVALYTSDWGGKTPQGLATVDLVINGEGPGSWQVGEVYPQGGAPSGQGQMVLSLPFSLQLQVAPGAQVILRQVWDAPWSQLQHLLTGGPLLVEEGKPVFQAVAEGFTGTVLQRNPRSAVGVDTQGRMRMVVVDGRQPEHSVGLTLEEMALLLAGMGLQTAMGLDSGGSTELWAGGNVINKPSDGRERALNNALVVVYGLPLYLNGERLYLDAPARIIDDRVYFPLRQFFQALGAQIYWNEQSQSVQVLGQVYDLILDFTQQRAQVNGQWVKLANLAQIQDGVTMVSAELVRLVTGAQIELDSNKRVNIRLKEAVQ